MLLNKVCNLFYIGAVCFISTSCTSNVNLDSTTISQPENYLNNKVIKLVTYQKLTSGSRAIFTVGALKEVNNCIYLSNYNGEIPIAFPNTFRIDNNSVSNGNLTFEIGKETNFIGHQTSLENAVSKLKISNNQCFNGKNMIWIFGQ